MMHLYIEDSAELQIYRPMLNMVHMNLYLYSILVLPMTIYQTEWRYGEGVGRGGHTLFGAPNVRPERGFDLMASRS